MRKLGITKVRKSSSFNTFDSFIFSLFVLYNGSILIKMVASTAVKSTTKILDPCRLFGTKFNEVLFALFYVKG